MKKYVFTLLFLAFSTMLSAQQTFRTEQLNAQKRRDTYSNRLGYDSVQFTISTPKDTLLKAFFYENGRLLRNEWTDSTHVYDVFGRLREVVYTRQPLSNRGYQNFSAAYYDFDGFMQRRPFTPPTGERGVEVFNRKNRRTDKYIVLVNTPSVNYAININSEGQKYHAHKSAQAYYARDSVLIHYDTTFYDNGQASTIDQATYTLKGGRNKGFSRKEYAKNGSLRVASLPDSLFLTPFKDNVDCYYGLKNQRGDIVYPPKFEQIKEISTVSANDLWQVEEGTKVVMMRKDGKVLSSIPMDNIEPMTSDKEYGRFEDDRPIPESTYNVLHGETSVLPTYFCFKKNNKFGIIDREGTLILPPQYPNFIRHDSAGTYFEITIKDTAESKNNKNNPFLTYSEDHASKRLVVDRNGKFLFDNRYPHVELTGLTPYFKFSNTPRTDTSRWFHLGLVDSSGAVLLNADYTSIRLNRENRLFWVSKHKEPSLWYYRHPREGLCGLFDPEKRTWVLDCIYRKDASSFQSDIIILTNMQTHKHGVVSLSGQIVLPFVYDTIIFSKEGGLWAMVQNGRYQLYDVEKQALSPTIYQHLAPIRFWVRNFNDEKRNAYSPNINLFIAQKNDKWGLIHLDGSVIVPLTYDYAGESDGNDGTALVKDNQATIFSDWLFPLPDPDKNVERDEFHNRPRILSFNLKGDTTNKIFAVNADNRVLYPPQYKIVKHETSWTLLENDAKERLLLFPESEKTVPFPYKNHLLWASGDCLLGVLYDENKQAYDIVNFKTQEHYQTITGGAVAIESKSGTYFVKTDTPVVHPMLNWSDLPRVSRDTFLIDDNNWKMFDAQGKPLTTNTFRYPILFLGGGDIGVGVGAVGDKFGVWRTDGSAVVPPQYKNARLCENYRRIALYQNMGLKTWLQLIDLTGKTLINTGRYDGISEFYGDYALVSLGDKIGLVDTNGREIIAPMSLQNDTYNLVDSLTQAARRFQKTLKNSFRRNAVYQQPFINIWQPQLAELSPDSLNVSQAVRNQLWHFLLETQVEMHIQRADVRKIQRAYPLKTYNEYKLYLEDTRSKVPTNSLRHLFADSLHISFALTSDSAAKSIFKNYWKTKTDWETKRLSDILNLSRDNLLKINDLMREKLKKLEGKDIDCGESTSFIERTQNTFLAHAKGISFCFTSDKKDAGGYRAFHYVPVLLTWAELKAFLN